MERAILSPVDLIYRRRQPAQSASATGAVAELRSPHGAGVVLGRRQVRPSILRFVSPARSLLRVGPGGDGTSRGLQ